MNKITIKQPGAKSINLQLPAAWNEITAKQLMHLALVLNMKLPVYHFAMAVLAGWMDLPRRLWQKLDPKEMYCIGNTLDYILKNDLTRTVIQKIRLGFTRYYGPGDFLRDVICIEYCKADTFYKSYINTKDDIYLHKLIATLYRPRQNFIWLKKMLGTWDGNLRKKYRDHFVDNHRRMRKLHPGLKYAILLQWQGCANQLPLRYKEAFAEHKKKGDGFGYASLIIGMAGEKFGTTQQTAEAPLHEVLIYLNQCSLQAREIEKEIEKIRRK